MRTRELSFEQAKVIRLGGPLVSAHLLVDAAGLTLVDTGLFGIPRELRRVVARLRRRPEELRDIVLTHGHLDHVGGAAEIQAWSGARVWVHPLDREHVEQRVRYRGWARGCGALEAAGRTVAHYRPPKIGAELQDGARLPLWGGLRVRHLPGHTPGHCALVAERAEARGLVFTGDLFASYAWSTHRPPIILTRDRARAERSLRSFVSELCAAQTKERPGPGLLPGHYDRMDPLLHRRRLLRLCRGPAAGAGQRRQ